MAYEKLKDESYANLGGMNTKASPYLTSQTECLNLINFDFSQVGSWTKRPGTTLWNGMSLGSGYRLTSLFEFTKLNGASAIFTSGDFATLQMSLPAGGFTTTGIFTGNNACFTPFVDYLFICGPRAEVFNNNGIFRKVNGVTFGASFPMNNTAVCPQPPYPAGSGSWGITAAQGGSLCGTTTIFVASYAFQNDRGFVGPPRQGITIILDGITFASLLYHDLNSWSYNGLGQTTIPGNGASAFMLLRSGPNDAAMFETQSISLGTTWTIDPGLPITANPARYSCGWTLRPRYSTVINNQFFATGFSNMPSRFFWSEVGEPEMFDPTWWDEIRTNDGDRISGITPFRAGGLIFKERSFAEIAANSSSDVSVFEVSSEYGCLSNRAIVQHDSYSYFLDKKGIVQYDGAQPKIISDRIEPIFRAMNVDTARDYACAINNRQRNELWFAIPTNGATLNNTLVVYDYVANGWAVWSGLNICSLFYGYGGTSTPRALFGDDHGRICEFGSSLTGDNGAGITCLIQTRFHHGLGDTVEKMYRRFFVNSTPVSGATIAINVNFYKNYGTSLINGAVAYQNPFQTRIDFGLSAKSISAEISNFSSTNTVQIPGYAFQYRFLRNV